MHKIGGGMINAQMIYIFIFVILLRYIAYMFSICEDTMGPVIHEVAQKFTICGKKA